MLALLLAATPSPSASTSLNDDAITPGVVGFLAILFVTLVTLLLIVDMIRRIRRVRYRGELADQRATEQPPAP
jgi:hypothetical protein